MLQSFEAILPRQKKTYCHRTKCIKNDFCICDDKFCLLQLAFHSFFCQTLPLKNVQLATEVTNTEKVFLETSRIAFVRDMNYCLTEMMCSFTSARHQISQLSFV